MTDINSAADLFAGIGRIHVQARLKARLSVSVADGEMRMVYGLRHEDSAMSVGIAVVLDYNTNRNA